MPLTFFLGPVLLHPVRYLPQAVKKELSFLQADDLGKTQRQVWQFLRSILQGDPVELDPETMFWLGGLEAHWG